MVSDMVEELVMVWDRGGDGLEWSWSWSDLVLDRMDGMGWEWEC